MTSEVSKEQLWTLFANVNDWPSWDSGLEYTHLEGEFKEGNFFKIRPKGGPKLKVKLLEVTACSSFTDVTYFPGAKMYDKHLFEETQNGLKITNTISVKGLFAFIWIRLVAKNIAGSLPEDMLKQVQASKLLQPWV